MTHESLLWPGPGGKTWTHRVQTRHCRITVTDRLMGDVGYVEATRNEAAQAIIIPVFEAVSVHRKMTAESFIAPGRTEHQWAVSFVMPDSNRNYFQEQIDKARLDGMRDAAKMLRETATRYHRVHGPCAHVLQDQLTDSASRIEAEASSRERTEPLYIANPYRPTP